MKKYLKITGIVALLVLFIASAGWGVKAWKSMELIDCTYVQDNVTLAATVTEINNACDDNTATAAEIVRVADVSTRIVTCEAETLDVTEALHEGRIVLLSRAAGVTATLPEATGSGGVYIFKVGVVPTSNAHVVAAKTTDTMSGLAMMQEAAGGTVLGWLVNGTDDKLSLNGTTTGGVTIGDTIICIDAQDTTWHVECFLTGSGTEATPASAS